MGSSGPVEIVGGPEKRTLVLVEHDPAWARRFEEERARIVGALGAAAVGVHHIGSTSVPGLAAKPVVDILVAVDDPDDDRQVAALVAAGYALRLREPGHRMLRTPEQRDVHVHLFRAGTWDVRRHLVFPAWLRRDRDDRESYEALKRSLIGRDWATMSDYAEAKTTLIAEIVERAESWAVATGWVPEGG